MVLQRGVPLSVWGVGEPGERIKVTFAHQSATAQVGTDGRWRVELDPLEASAKGRTLVVAFSSGSRQVFSDILVGEVWIVAGQSNAGVPIWSDAAHVRDAYGGIKAQITRRPQIRFCKVRPEWSSEPRPDFSNRVSWVALTPENVQRLNWNFPAYGYYAVLELCDALGVPIGVFAASYGASPIEAWVPETGYRTHPDLVPGKFKPPYCQPKVLWNALLEPVAQMAVRGVMWYQGCHNSSSPAGYAEKMHALYDGWRDRFAGLGLKFLFVQLPPYGNGVVALQEEQAKFAAEEPNAWMAVINDLGNLDDIHPNHKYGVGLRLAALALRHVYGETNLVADSPTLKSWRVDGGRFRLTFDNVRRWSLASPDWSTDAGFEIAGADGRFVKAELENLVVREKRPYKSDGKMEGLELVVSSKDVTEPRHLRFLHSRPWYGALVNEAGLPVGPFHIDVR